MGLFDKLFPSQNERQLKSIRVIADKVCEKEAEFKAMTDEQLQEMTPMLKQEIANGKSLEDILPLAFATVREAAWRVIKQRPYYVQIMGGIVLHQGRICQMSTGEGKTLVSTLPAYLNALMGKGVHIITVNEYLAKRDCEWMGKIHRFLGLSVGVILNRQEQKEKQAAYACDITYGTNNEFGFDYLRDNMAMSANALVQRDLNYCIIDEVDSILIDEARTPLIIAGAGDKSSDDYKKADRFIKGLKSEDYEYEEKEKAVRLTDSGIEKAERYYSIDNLSDIENTSLNHFLNQSLRANVTMKRDSNYIVENGEILIVDEFTGRKMEGRRFSNGLHQAIEAKEGVRVREENRTLATISFQNLFRLYKKLSGMTGTAKTEEGEFNSIYNLDVVVIPTNKPCIRIDYDDVIYSTHKGKINAIVNDIKERHKSGQPLLIGTITVEKSEELSAELSHAGIKHNVLNAKNHEKEAEIVAQAGRKNAVTIATNMAGRGTDILLGGNMEFMAKQEMHKQGFKFEEIEIACSYAEGDNETDRLQKIYRQLLSRFENEIAMEKNEVISVGGLHIMGTERHESRRIDDQLRGRSGRQGDPGSSVFFISLEDDLARVFGGEKMQGMFNLLKVDENTPISNSMITKSIETAQKNIEGRNFGARKSVVQYDDVFNLQRNLIYSQRRKVLNGEDIHSNIMEMVNIYCDNSFNKITNGNMNSKTFDIDKMQKEADRYLPECDGFFADSDKERKVEDIKEEWSEAVKDYINNRLIDGKAAGIDYGEVERYILLRTITSKWMEHIDDMENLKDSVRLQAFGQKDPLIMFKQMGYDMFMEMQNNIQMDTIRFLLFAQVRRTQATELKAEGEINAEKNFNGPCPCGSGLKYKNCCGKEEHKKLMEEERKAKREARKA
ncbi:MAG: preprotein translocase subunit SecA [Clostridia bacterium]